MKNTFVNPYVFFPLKNAKDRCNEKKDIRNFYSEKHTGYLEVSLVTKTPLFIPNTTNDHYIKIKPEIAEHKSYDFYSYHNLEESLDKDELPSYEPVIPGSELRGCIRFLHEVLNNSCLNSIDENQIIFARLSPTQANQVTPGILRREGNTWYFRKADKIKCKGASYNSLTKKIILNGESFENGSLVYYEDDYRKNVKRAKNVSHKSISYDCKSGYLFRMMPHPSDNGGFEEGIVIFKPKDEGEYRLSEKEVSNLEAVVRNYQDDRFNTIDMTEYEDIQAKDFYSDYMKDETKVYPVFRSKEQNMAKNQYYFSPAHIGKYLNHQTLKDKIKGYEACETLDECCKTCSLFGFIGKNSKESHSSRIRFTDAVPVNESGDYSDWYQNPITLNELLGPHLSNLEFYTYSTIGKDLEKGRFDDPDRKIRGRKYYWHHPVDESTVRAKDGSSKLNVTIRPLKAEKEFRFRIFYENLSSEELERLISAVDLDRLFCNGKKHMQKLGYAKPFGYGSVEMKILRNVEREITLKEEKIKYTEVEKDITPFNDFDSEIMKEVDYVTDYNAVRPSEEVRYPYAMEADADGKYPGFAWFSNNKSGKLLEQTLPTLPDIISGKAEKSLRRNRKNK